MTALVKNRWFWICLVITLVGAGVWGWMERATLLAMYYAREVVQADDETRSEFFPKLVAQDRAALRPLLDYLRSHEPKVCVNSGWALQACVRYWGADHPIVAVLMEQLQARIAAMSPVGRGEALAIAECALTTPCDLPLDDRCVENACQLLHFNVENAADATRPAAVSLALVLVRQGHAGDILLKSCRKLTAEALKDTRPECRANAVRLAALPGVEMRDHLVGLLSGEKRDASAEVRALALFAVGAHEELIATDELLPLLQDSDETVRTICEKALRSRGLRSPHVQLAKQMMDQQPGVRARVPAQVPLYTDIDSKIWLERLSRDPSPAVRAAVIRAAAESGQDQLRDRLREMAKDDPSPTVRQIAEYYLRP